VCGDIGQGGDELKGLEEKALKTGASEVHVADMREEFVTDYLWKLVRAGGVYEHKYLLGTSIARPLLAKRQVEVALATGCDGLAHGCTGKGNDQVRFELTYKALAPHFPSSLRGASGTSFRAKTPSNTRPSTTCRSRRSTTKIYSRDRNIWHISHEGGALEDPANAAPDDIWMLTKQSQRRARQAGRSDHRFRKRRPVSVNGQRDRLSFARNAE
jgi:argininosuccinate synthase